MNAELFSIPDLPDYFVSFSENEIKNILSNPNKEFKIIACGREASAGSVFIMTGEFNVVKIKSRYLPEGRVFPSDNGDSVFFYDANKKYDAYYLISGAYLLN